MARTLTHHIERLRQKPDHVRHTIALATSGAVTGVIALAWVGTLAASGTLSLKPSNVIASAPASEMGQALSDTKSSFSQLLGAAGAAIGATTTGSGPAALTIVETKTSSTVGTGADERTVIPF